MSPIRGGLTPEVYRSVYVGSIMCSETCTPWRRAKADRLTLYGRKYCGVRDE